jgi:hypothetical protein
LLPGGESSRGRHDQTNFVVIVTCVGLLIFRTIKIRRVCTYCTARPHSNPTGSLAGCELVVIFAYVVDF